MAATSPILVLFLSKLDIKTVCSEKYNNKLSWKSICLWHLHWTECCKVAENRKVSIPWLFVSCFEPEMKKKKYIPGYNPLWKQFPDAAGRHNKHEWMECAHPRLTLKMPFSKSAQGTPTHKHGFKRGRGGFSGKERRAESGGWVEAIDSIEMEKQKKMKKRWGKIKYAFILCWTCGFC